MDENKDFLRTIKHKFLDHKVDPGTETLIVGTFNPCAKGNNAEFFYSRPRNYFWTVAPLALNHVSLKQKKLGDQYEEKINQKKDFIREYKIDFIDLISEIEVERGQETNYDDKYIDAKVPEWGWRNVVEELQKLGSLKRVCFTRKTLSDIPRMKPRVEAINSYCQDRAVHFQFITTPSRPPRKDRPNEWSDFFKSG
ncbi:hypothetical protein AB7645_17025 [Bradyrhizobium sp. 956_D2_N1_5]|uniref:hypothetical protein n=1 Tax=unclassified Bradyrhizobium TaxID=2631580 RepID=UPI003F1EEF29